MVSHTSLNQRKLLKKKSLNVSSVSQMSLKCYLGVNFDDVYQFIFTLDAYWNVQIDKGPK